MKKSVNRCKAYQYDMHLESSNKDNNKDQGSCISDAAADSDDVKSVASFRAIILV